METQTPFEKKAMQLHSRYIFETGLSIPFCDSVKRDWYEWLKWSRETIGHEWGERELLAVLSYIRSNHDRQWHPKMMKISTLIRFPAEFAEKLAMADARPKRWDNRTKVLAQSGRPPAKAYHDTARHIGEVIRDPKGDIGDPKNKEWIKRMREAVDKGG